VSPGTPYVRVTRRRDGHGDAERTSSSTKTGRAKSSENEEGLARRKAFLVSIAERLATGGKITSGKEESS